MKEIMEQVDRLLGMVEVRGDSVMILAEARKALGAAYQTVLSEREKKGEGKA